MRFPLVEKKARIAQKILAKRFLPIPTRQVVGNLKESLLPWANQQLKVRRGRKRVTSPASPDQMAKMSFDLFGALSPTEGLEGQVGSRSSNLGQDYMGGIETTE
jgi:hypothetical protein